MEEAGYKVILDSEIERFRRFQKYEDERRAENLMAIWLNPEVKAVISPLLSGQPGGLLLDVTLPNGQKLESPVPGVGSFKRTSEPE